MTVVMPTSALRRFVRLPGGFWVGLSLVLDGGACSQVRMDRITCRQRQDRAEADAGIAEAASSSASVTSPAVCHVLPGLRHGYLVCKGSSVPTRSGGCHGAMRSVR
jgi:hypothetical protein